MIVEKKKNSLLDIDYSFYEDLFNLEIDSTASEKEKNDLSKLLISLKSCPEKVLSGYPSIKVKSQGSLDPRYTQFYCYKAGQTYWKRVDLDQAAKYVLNFAESNQLYIFDRQKIDSLISKLLYREAVELKFPGENVRSGEIWVNFQDKHLIINEVDHSWRIEQGNPNYYFRHALQINFMDEFKQMFPKLSGNKIPILWDGKEILDNPLFLWLYDITNRDMEYLEYLQKILGVWITSSQGISGKFYMVIGPPQTGKSSFLRIVEYLIGQFNCCHLTLNDLADDKKTHTLEYSQLNIVYDLANLSSSIAQRALTLIKQTTGGDTFTVNPKYVQPYSIVSAAKHIFAANEFIRFLHPGTGKWAEEAFWDRIIGLPFYTPLSKFRELPPLGKRDPDFIKNLIQDNLIWCYMFALEGLFKFLKTRGFNNRPLVVNKFMSSYKSFMKQNKAEYNSIEVYFSSFSCINFFKKDRRLSDIYKHYLKWCFENNESTLLNKVDFFSSDSDIWKKITAIRTKHRIRWYNFK